jgi:hypothetical protein
VNNVGSNSKSFSKSSQHHDNLSDSGHKSFGNSKPKSPKSFSDGWAGAKLPSLFGPGTQVKTHGDGKKNSKKR